MKMKQIHNMRKGKINAFDQVLSVGNRWNAIVVIP